MIYLFDPPIDGIKESNFRFNEVIGSGANARVFKEKIGNHYYAIKIYNDPTKCNEAKLRAMLKNAPDVYGQYSSIDHPLFGWVLGLVIDKNTNRPIGFVMPLVDDKKSKTLDYFYDSILTKKLNSNTSQALSFKVEIIANLCSAIDDLHKHGHKFVDLKPQNLRVFEGTNIVSLIDCDGYTIFDHDTGNEYRADMVSTDYIAPEINKLDLKKDAIPKSQDEYALAVIIFQMLNRGVHPFQGILKSANILATTNDEKAVLGLYPYGRIKSDKTDPLPISIHELMLDETRELFDKAFTTQNRPSAEEWKKHFKEILESKKIVRCQSYPKEIAHMRFQGKECPACRKTPVLQGTARTSVATPVSGHPSLTMKPGENSSKNDLKTVLFLMALFAIPLLAIIWNYQSGQKSVPQIVIEKEKSTQTPENQADLKPNDVKNTTLNLEFCNGTVSLVKIYLSYPIKNQQRVIGPYDLPSYSCEKFTLVNRSIAWHAQTDKGISLSEKDAKKESFCIKAKGQTDIAAKTKCEGGEVRRQFNQLIDNMNNHRIILQM